MRCVRVRQAGFTLDASRIASLFKSMSAGSWAAVFTGANLKPNFALNALCTLGFHTDDAASKF